MNQIILVELTWIYRQAVWQTSKDHASATIIYLKEAYEVLAVFKRCCRREALLPTQWCRTLISIGLNCQWNGPRLGILYDMMDLGAGRRRGKFEHFRALKRVSEASQNNRKRVRKLFKSKNFPGAYRRPCFSVPVRSSKLCSRWWVYQIILTFEDCPETEINSYRLK